MFNKGSRLVHKQSYGPDICFNYAGTIMDQPSPNSRDNGETHIAFIFNISLATSEFVTPRFATSNITTSTLSHDLFSHSHKRIYTDTASHSKNF